MVLADKKKFVILRHKRIKTWAHAYHVSRHNVRETDCRHLEKGARPPRLLIGPADVAGAVSDVLDRYGIVHKPGEVMAIEYVVSTSREVFEGLTEQEYQNTLMDFCRYTLAAFTSRFTIPGQIVSMALHEDERTPHLHIIIVPLIFEPDERRTDKTPFYRLSAKRVIGGRGDMAREQTRFASYFKDMGLERGAERSGARNISNRDHEATLEAARQAATRECEALAADRERLAETVRKLNEGKRAIAAEREQIAAERARVQAEDERLATDRRTVMQAAAEAAELKSKAIRRIRVLDRLVKLGEEFRSQADAVPYDQLPPLLRKARTAATQLSVITAGHTKDDEWMAATMQHQIERNAPGR